MPGDIWSKVRRPRTDTHEATVEKPKLKSGKAEVEVPATDVEMKQSSQASVGASGSVEGARGTEGQAASADPKTQGLAQPIAPSLAEVMKNIESGNPPSASRSAAGAGAEKDAWALYTKCFESLEIGCEK